MIEKKGTTDTKASNDVGSPVRVQFYVKDVDSPFSLDMDTSYQLKIAKENDNVNVMITADYAFGLRYALVTLSQLVVFDDIRREMLVSESVS